jgi:hypothetical protein
VRHGGTAAQPETTERWEIDCRDLGLNWRAHRYFWDETTLRQLGILDDRQ